MELVDRNPAAEIHSLMRPYKRGHYRALDHKDLSAFLGALERNEARLMWQTRLALNPLPGERRPVALPGGRKAKKTVC